MAEYLSQQINRLRKTGKLKEAWDIGVSEVKANPNDIFLKGAFFWVCYDSLKAVQNPIVERGKNNKKFNPRDNEAERIRVLLDWVIWLDLPPGGFEYPRLFFLFRKNLDCFPQLVLCLLKHQEALFSDEEKKPFQGDKGESPSLMLSCARKVAKAWMESRQAFAINIDDVLRFLNVTRADVRDRQQKIWLDYDEAKCLIMAGRFDEARTFIIPVLRKKQTESWPWGALAATYQKENIDAAITLFAQGLCHAHDEKFALPLLKGISPLLAGKGFAQEASMCIKKTVNCYQENGWNIKADLEKLLGQPWFDGTVNIEQLKPFLQQQAKGAMEFLLGPTKTVYGLVTNLHKSGKGLHIYLSEQESISVPLKLFQKPHKPKIGDYAEVSIAGEGEEKTVTLAILTSSQKLPGVETVQEKLKVTEKGFGFAGDTFIPSFLIKDGMDNMMVEVLRYKDFDKKKGRMGWRALLLEVCTA